MSSESLASIEVTPSTRMRQGTSASVISNYSPNSWLLRLFQSEFFDIRFAVLYLAKYLKVVGIQNYICKELDKFPEDVLLSILPQLCHLLITRTTEAVCIESLLLDKCKGSAHVAIQVRLLCNHWFLYKYLTRH